jgi:uncharacterized protein
VPSLIVRDGKDGVVLTVHVQPNAARTDLVGIHGDAVKIRIAASPVDGAANRELIRFLAEEFSLPTAAIHIQSGAGGRRKRVSLKGTTAVQVAEHLIRKGLAKG